MKRRKLLFGIVIEICQAFTENQNVPNEAEILQKLRFEPAFAFYTEFILNQKKLNLLAEYGFNAQGTVSSQDWELFAAILTGKKATGSYGADLPGLEVKSAIHGGSFEYQYHKKAGLSKLKEDMEIAHLFISYGQNYEDVVVRFADATVFRDKFKSWEPELTLNYQGTSKKQRFRKSLGYGAVIHAAKVILEIKSSKLKFRYGRD